MTDTPAKPLTADEIACFKTNIDTQTIWYVRRESDIPDQYTYSECSGMPDIDRLIATIEQQAEQIEKLREGLLQALPYVPEHHGQIIYLIEKALTATESVNDK